MKDSKIHNGIKVAIVLGGIGIAIPAVWAQGIGLRALEEAMVSTEFKVERGKTVYDRNCVRCHGPDGSGQTEYSQKLEQPPPNLAEGEYRWSGAKVQTYNVIAKGSNGHPVFKHLPYQDRWAVTHYVRSLGPTDQYVDPPEAVDQLRFEAENGVCDDSVKSSIDQKMEFKGETQIEQGMNVYTANCSSCHGAEGAGDGPAAAALEPKPRNFQKEGAEWTKTNGTSPLAIFDTLANGIEGTSMASFAHLSEEDRWAMVHLIREKWLPASMKKDASEEQVLAVCRTLSASGAGRSIPVSSAMRFLSEDIREQRAVRYQKYGTTWVHDSAMTPRGEKLFTQHCQSCHGPDGSGNQLGPYGAFPPYLFVDTGPLVPASAGGTFLEFAKRSMKGAHVALPDMTGASQLSSRDWMALQAYVATFDGPGTVKPASERHATADGEAAEGEAAEGSDDAAAPDSADAETADKETEQPANQPSEEAEEQPTEDETDEGAAPAEDDSEETASDQE